jgi:hypothetical protein
VIKRPDYVFLPFGSRLDLLVAVGSYHRCKAGFPLPGGMAWKPVELEFRSEWRCQVIELKRGGMNRISTLMLGLQVLAGRVFTVFGK